MYTMGTGDKVEGEKAGNIGNCWKLFYHGEDGRRNGVGVIFKGDNTRRVLEAKRLSNALMCMKLGIEDVMIVMS